MIRRASCARHCYTARCTVRACLSVKPVGVNSLEALQDLGRSNARSLGEPDAYLLVHFIQHRWTPGDRFAPPVGATMGWTLFTLPPGDPQPGGKTFEIDCSCRL